MAFSPPQLEAINGVIRQRLTEAFVDNERRLSIFETRLDETLIRASS